MAKLARTMHGLLATCPPQAPVALVEEQAEKEAEEAEEAEKEAEEEPTAAVVLAPALVLVPPTWEEDYPAPKVATARARLDALKWDRPTWISTGGLLDAPNAPGAELQWMNAVGVRELRPMLKAKAKELAGKELTSKELTKACSDEMRQVKLNAKSGDEATRTTAQAQLAAWRQAGTAAREENDRHIAEYKDMLAPLKVPVRPKRQKKGTGRDPIRRAAVKSPAEATYKRHRR